MTTMWVYLKLLLTMAFWGGTFIAARVAVQTMGPFSAAFCRFAIATLCLLVLTYSFEGRLPPLKGRQIPLVVILGLSGVFAYNAFFFSGLQTTSAGRASLIVALNPSVVAIASALFLNDRLTRLKMAGIATSLLGAAVVIGHGNPFALLSEGMSRGDGFIVGCVLSWVVYTLVGKFVMQDLSPFAATTYACLVGTAALFATALAEGIVENWSGFSPQAWWGVLYLGILGTAAGFSWYYEGVKAIGSSKASIFINLVPVFAISFAALILGEPITLPLILGGALVIIGIYLTNRPASQSP